MVASLCIKAMSRSEIPLKARVAILFQGRKSSLEGHAQVQFSGPFTRQKKGSLAKKNKSERRPKKKEGGRLAADYGFIEDNAPNIHGGLFISPRVFELA